MGNRNPIHFRLEFPAPPNMSQHVAHYWKRHSEKKKYERIAHGYLLSQWRKMPQEARQFPWPKFQWILHAEVWSLMDFDNLLTLAKWPLDVLKKGGIITDDSPKFAALGGIPTQEVKRSKERKVYLDIQFKDEEDNGPRNHVPGTSNYGRS